MHIGIGEHHDVARALGDGDVEHAVLAHPRQVQDPNARVVEAACQGHGAVAGAIAGDDDLQAFSVIILGQQVAQLVVDVAFLVVRGHHHANPLRWQRCRCVAREQRPQHGEQLGVA
ncbi:hypothetical protein D3C76_1638990 [compost metagenome]